MKLKRILVSVIVFATALAGFAQQMQMPSIPVDKDVRIGKLSNGLTYYIRHNNWPEHRAEFYIAQKVGSIQENEDQRGLAHFLEHMCFNGTTHFPGDNLLRWCESIGVKFGTDLNAYTSIDQTVYNISNVPTARRSAVDSCLLILRDWAGDLILDPTEIDKERGVIHEEWRMRTSAQMRLLERNLPKLYPGCKYGLRMPIGLMSVVDNFKPKALRQYYEKWYRPDNQGIIVVGDVDVDYIEAQIKRLFSDAKVPANAAQVIDEQVPDNAEPIVIIDKDKEQRMNSVQLMFKHNTTPDSLKTSVAYLMMGYAKSAAISMLNDRLGEYAQKADCPYISGSAGDGQYVFAKTKDAFSLSAMPKDGYTLPAAIAAVYREALRAADFGFTATEYSRYKADILSSLDKMYSNKDKRYNSQFCDEYKEHFLGNEPIPSIDDYYQIMKQMVPNVPLEAINQTLKMLVSKSDANMVLLNFNNEKEGATYPTEAEFLDAIHKVRAEKLTAYVDNVKNEPLIQTLPKKGSVKKETKNDKFGYKEWTLSNGAKVVLKKTDYKKDQVIVSGVGYGGASLYGPADYTNLKVFGNVIGASGLGNFSSTELPKALAGKIASASLGLSSTRVSVGGQSTPNDLETLFQLIYLHFTGIKKDQESFDNLIKSFAISLKNKALSPDNAFKDSVSYTMNCHNPRSFSLDTNDLKDINYDRILQIAKEATSNAAAFTFTVMGNYDEDQLRSLVEQYIASLPSQKKVVKGHSTSTPFHGVVLNHFKRKMESPKANSVIAWNSYDIPYTLENCVRADIAGQVLSMIYLKKIREDEGAAYSCGADAGVSRGDKELMAQIIAFCPVKPEKADIALNIMRDEALKMTKTCDADMVKKVKEYMLKNYDDAVKTNSYWMGVISNWREYGVDMDTNYKAVVEKQTPETIAAFVAEVLKAGNRMEVVMMPQE